MSYCINTCPICDTILKRAFLSNKNKYLCSDNKDHVFYLDTNISNEILSIFAAIDQHGISWVTDTEKTLTIWIPINSYKFAKINLNYFDPNLIELKNQFKYIVDKYTTAKILL